MCFFINAIKLVWYSQRSGGIDEGLQIQKQQNTENKEALELDHQKELQNEQDIDEWHQIRKQQDKEYEELLMVEHQKELQKQQECKEKEEQRHGQEVMFV